MLAILNIVIKVIWKKLNIYLIGDSNSIFRQIETYKAKIKIKLSRMLITLEVKYFYKTQRREVKRKLKEYMLKAYQQINF